MMAGVLLGDCIGVDYISFTEASGTFPPSSYSANSLRCLLCYLHRILVSLIVYQNTDEYIPLW
jgi:hypothetical protein